MLEGLDLTLRRGTVTALVGHSGAGKSTRADFGYIGFRAWGARAVLKGLDLTLRKGTVTALVGHSGAGKSTVASLLSRFYEPQAGGIWLGGQPASAFTRGEWARAVALVSQEPVLFAGAPIIYIK